MFIKKHISYNTLHVLLLLTMCTGCHLNIIFCGGVGTGDVLLPSDSYNNVSMWCVCVCVVGEIKYIGHFHLTSTVSAKGKKQVFSAWHHINLTYFKLFQCSTFFFDFCAIKLSVIYSPQQNSEFSMCGSR